MLPSAKDDLQLYKMLTGDEHYTNDRTLSQDVASLFIPRRSDIAEKKSTGSEEGWYLKLYEPHPINAAGTLATGQYDLLFTGEWFRTDAPVNAPEHAQKVAYYEVGKRMRKAIDASNFKLEVQEFLADRSTTHTAAMLIEHEDGELFHTHIPRGRYAICENHKKQVDTLVRWFCLTARQAVQKFAEEDDNLPDAVRKAAGETASENKKFTFVHVIRPNWTRDKDSEHKKDKPWSSRYICEEHPTQHVRVSGYDEQPFVVSRFNRWGDSPYGTGPAHIEMGRARGLQVMRRDMLALGSRVSSPGVFMPEGADEEWDPYGVNWVPADVAASGLPREIRYSENFSIPEALYEAEKRAIDESFFVPMFKLLLNDMDREKTAFETAKMLEERVALASPTFSRLNEEVLNIYLTRVFGILLRAGRFDDIIDDLVIEELEGGRVNVRDPQVTFTSKLAMAMKAVESNNFMQWMNENNIVIQLKPEVLDNIDWDSKVRKSWEAHGLDVSQMVDEKKRDAKREEQMQMQQIAMALQAGGAASEIQKNLNAG